MTDLLELNTVEIRELLADPALATLKAGPVRVLLEQIAIKAGAYGGDFRLVLQLVATD